MEYVLFDQYICYSNTGGVTQEKMSWFDSSFESTFKFVFFYHHSVGCPKPNFGLLKLTLIILLQF